MKKFIQIFALFYVVSCASPALLKFPISEYIDDENAVELRFACITTSSNCIAGLYLDNMQIHEAWGDYRFQGGMLTDKIYSVKIPPSKYKFSSSTGNASHLDRFLDISQNSCAIYIADTPDFNYFNIFEKLKPNELVWSLVDCTEFNKMTSGFDELKLTQSVSFSRQKQ